ncbi:glycosyltransferase family 4 protein [Pedobacter sp. ASV28]|jgi:glycosyltransferase involved in cell wall biosynthesis|uniref:glycosyltransferase family 4 protein n=1 Tax=Pedobacter sp. ASV28 TaxID=2795123 RepID=UPI0018ED5153|nr:glycosyltransferase family 4 protein [Pedobacter sp. ASV28]
MKDLLLLIMTPNMSLEKWHKAGLLSRELDIYKKLCLKTGLRLCIYSYGRNEQAFIKNKDIILLQMPKWIPQKIPFKAQNLFYNLVSPIFYYGKFRRSRIAKTNQYTAGFFGLLLKIIFRIPLVIRMGYYHTHLKKISRTSRFLEYVTFHICDCILVTSLEASSFIRYTYGIKTEKIYACCNAIDLEQFRPMQISKDVDVLFVGRLEKVKNITLLISFLQMTELKVLIIGDGSMSGLIKDISALKRNITWIKRIDNKDLPIYYNRSKVYILISSFEGNPKSLLEAMACGLPCIGTNVPGIRECIVDGVTGNLINNDLTALNSRINQILESPNYAAIIGQNALSWVLKECNMHENISREYNFYRHLIGDEDDVHSTPNFI